MNYYNKIKKNIFVFATKHNKKIQSLRAERSVAKQSHQSRRIISRDCRTRRLVRSDGFILILQTNHNYPLFVF
jgi:hypothetical protein